MGICLGRQVASIDGKKQDNSGIIASFLLFALLSQRKTRCHISQMAVALFTEVAAVQRRSPLQPSVILSSRLVLSHGMEYLSAEFSRIRAEVLHVGPPNWCCSALFGNTKRTAKAVSNSNKLACGVFGSVVALLRSEETKQET